MIRCSTFRISASSNYIGVKHGLLHVDSSEG